MASPRQNRQGFSLVELSIVLVILGLLVGGVLSGQSLIRAAEVRSVATEFAKYTTAVNSFRDKYFYYPGDMLNAVKFWGAQAGTTADGMDNTCRLLTTQATDARTCNGNGDGFPDSTGITIYEQFRFWQHLQNAGMVEGSLGGVHGPEDLTQAHVGLNIPPARLNPQVGWRIESLGSFVVPSNNPSMFGGSYPAYFSLENPYEFDGNIKTPALRPQEAWNIDKKLDDGRPDQGKIITQKYDVVGRPNCLVPTNDAYNLSYSDFGCLELIFKLQ